MKTAEKLFDFINSSPTPYHTVETVRRTLIGAGYTELSEKSQKGYTDGGKHFVTRGGSSIIAFRGRCDEGGFIISAAHCDSPAFRVKSVDNSVGTYSRVKTERYGGMMNYTWLDRPLSVAGRVTVRTKDGVETRLVSPERDLMVIPSVAIHLKRDVNDNLKLNPAQDLIPLFSAGGNCSLMDIVAAELGVSSDDIISHDLTVYNRQSPVCFGDDGDLILSPRLDCLQCVYSALEAFVSAPETDKSVSVLALFDDEEIGSETKQGAASTFLDFTLRRIAGGEEKYLKMLADSFMISLDNAHALHPNHPELSDPDNAPILGRGPVIKHNASHRYTTDGLSEGIFAVMAERAGVKTQHYYNRADIPGGATLGSIANTRVSVTTVDVGLPQLAMHSAMETASARDVNCIIEVLREAYSSGVFSDGNTMKILK